MIIFARPWEDAAGPAEGGPAERRRGGEQSDACVIFGEEAEKGQLFEAGRRGPVSPESRGLRAGGGPAPLS